MLDALCSSFIRGTTTSAELFGDGGVHFPHDHFGAGRRTQLLTTAAGDSYRVPFCKDGDPFENGFALGDENVNEGRVGDGHRCAAGLDALLVREHPHLDEAHRIGVLDCAAFSGVSEAPGKPFLEWVPLRPNYIVDSAVAILTTRVAMCSRAALVASSSSFWLLPPVIWLTPYGLPSANFNPSV